MNIEDVPFDIEQLGGECPLKIIFNRQRELMEKYHPIEDKNALLLTSDVPVDLNDRFGQMRLKDFAWRVTEELAEALDALDIENGVTEHVQEEMADAFHFLVELGIRAGLTSESFLPAANDALHGIFLESAPSETLDNAVLGFIRELGRTMNTLKNKPWKQTHMLTDVPRFKYHLKKSFLWFAAICYRLEMNSGKLFELYFRKSEVNKFRQRSQY